RVRQEPGHQVAHAVTLGEVQRGGGVDGGARVGENPGWVKMSTGVWLRTGGAPSLRRGGVRLGSGGVPPGLGRRTAGVRRPGARVAAVDGTRCPEAGPPAASSRSSPAAGRLTSRSVATVTTGS